MPDDESVGLRERRGAAPSFYHTAVSLVAHEPKAGLQERVLNAVCRCRGGCRAQVALPRRHLEIGVQVPGVRYGDFRIQVMVLTIDCPRRIGKREERTCQGVTAFKGGRHFTVTGASSGHSDWNTEPADM